MSGSVRSINIKQFKLRLELHNKLNFNAYQAYKYFHYNIRNKLLTGLSRNLNDIIQSVSSAIEKDNVEGYLPTKKMEKYIKRIKRGAEWPSAPKNPIITNKKNSVIILNMRNTINDIILKIPYYIDQLTQLGRDRTMGREDINILSKKEYLRRFVEYRQAIDAFRNDTLSIATDIRGIINTNTKALDNTKSYTTSNRRDLGCQCVGNNYGSWEDTAGSNVKMIPSVNVNRVYCTNTKYCINGGPDLLSGYENPVKLRATPKHIQNLVRYGGETPSNWPLRSASASWGLYILYKTYLSMGQTCMAQQLRSLCETIAQRWRSFVAVYVKHRTKKQYLSTFVGITNNVANTQHSWSSYRPYLDDFVRHNLKCVSTNSYVYTFSYGPAYMLLTHLHALTGKCPHTRQQIIDDINDWTSNNLDGVQKGVDMRYFDIGLKEITTAWTPPVGPMLSFNDYSNDVMRWGTAGGAPPVVINGEKIKSKWAWGMDKCFDSGGQFRADRQVYRDSLSGHKSQVATVALKEEPQKTREIISTPISSYLRQSYLAYRWGKPKLPSPISSSNWITLFEKSGGSWYGCIDGERFDQTISKEMIIAVIAALGTLDEQTKLVADSEIAHLETLKIEWSNITWEWNGGLLSGWRFTSIIGSIVSFIAARYILEQLHLSASCKIGVMGDDVVLYSNTIKIPASDLVAAYNAFGLRANLGKTVSGGCGEFLRKVRSSRGSLGFPALGLRSVIYANPWINSYQYSAETECSNNWLTFISRLLPHSVTSDNFLVYTYKLMLNDISLSFGPNSWPDWLLTPISAGGGGTIEVMDNQWYTLRTKYVGEFGSFQNRDRLFSMVGISNTDKRIQKNKTLEYINPSLLFRDINYDTISLRAHTLTFRDNISITDAIMGIAENRFTINEINLMLTNPLPTSAKHLRSWPLINYIMAGTDDKKGFTTIVMTKEAQNGYTSVIEGLTMRYLNTRKLPITTINVAKTCILLKYFTSTTVPYGTW